MIDFTLKEQKEKKSEVPFDGQWVQLSQTGVTWYGFNSGRELHLSDCHLYANTNGRDVTIIAPVEDKKDPFECWFKGSIRERFVEPGVDNLKEMEEWFECISVPHTIAIGFEQWLPDQKVLVPTYYAVKMDTPDMYDKWLQYMILKSLEQRGM